MALGTSTLGSGVNPALVSYKVVEAGYLSLLSAIAYSDPNNGGTLVAVADPKTALTLEKYQSPAFVLAYAREDMISHVDENIGGALFKTMMFWDLYVISSNFSIDGAGRLAGIEIDVNLNDPGAFQMMDDALAALHGQLVPGSPVMSKVFPAQPLSVLHNLTENRVVYRMRFRNQWQRIGPSLVSES